MYGRMRAHARSGKGSRLLLLPALALTLAACGSSSNAPKGVDPATLVPASAPMYVGAEVQPGEPLRASARAAASALTHQANAYVRLLALLQTPGSPPLDFARDVQPWLGPKAGVFVGSPSGSRNRRSAGAGLGDLLALLQRALAGETPTSPEFPFSTGGVDGAVLLDTSSASKAQTFLAAQAAHAGAHASSYRGVAYSTTGAGVAFASVKSLAVIGSEAAVHAVIDTSLGGPALAGEGEYAKLTAVAPAGALARVYVNPREALAAGAKATTGAATGETNALALLSQLNGGRPLNASVVPSASSIALDLDSPVPGATNAGGGLLSASVAGAQALGELPAESWLGIGLGGGGPSVGAGVRGLRGLFSLLSSSAASSNGLVSVKGLLAAFLAPLDVLGADTPAARRDFQEWMSSAALFASGSGLLNLKGGVAILSANPARSREAVSKLAAQLRRSGVQVSATTIPGTDAAAAVRIPTLPLPLVIANGRDAAGHTKFVIGLGEGSVTAVLGATQTLAGGAALTAATAALGGGIQPTMIVDFPTLLGLLEAVGLTEDPSIAPLVGYARSLTTLAGGGEHPANGIERLRIVVGLRGQGPEGAG